MIRHLVVPALLASPLAAGTRQDAAPEPARGRPGVELAGDAIASVIQRHLGLDEAVAGDAVEVRVEDGVATLEGEASNLLAKERAARVAEAVKGVRAVVNLVEVAESGRSDDEIRSWVENALVQDPATERYQVRVSATNGIVELTGEVDSWTEKELAGTVAKSVTGVRRLENEIEVAPPAERRPQRIEREIEEALRWSVLVDHGLIDVTVDEEGVARLSGTVGSAAEKRQAIRLARTTGVRSVEVGGLVVGRWARDDDLRRHKYVDLSEGEVAAAVRAALSRDPRVSTSDVAVEVKEDVVSLRGSVDSLKAKRAAEQSARNTVGARWVTNDLMVRPHGEREDESVADDVRLALERDPFVEHGDVSVKVEGGTAYLSGRADTWFEKGQADDAASRVSNVTEVVNRIEVADRRPYSYDPHVDRWSIHDHAWYGSTRAAGVADDAELAERIRDELYWTPFVDAEDVEVRVEDGVAILTGRVASWLEWRAARDHALAAGAALVRSRLRVGVEDGAEGEEPAGASRQ